MDIAPPSPINKIHKFYKTDRICFSAIFCCLIDVCHFVGLHLIGTQITNKNQELSAIVGGENEQL